MGEGTTRHIGPKATCNFNIKNLPLALHHRIQENKNFSRQQSEQINLTRADKVKDV